MAVQTGGKATFQSTSGTHTDLRGLDGVQPALTTMVLVWWQRNALKQEDSRRCGQSLGSIGT